MFRVEIFGDRMSDPGPNNLAHLISGVSMRVPGILAYPVTAPTRAAWEEGGLPSFADCYFYTRRSDDQLKEAIKASEQREVPLVVLSTGIDKGVLDSCNTLVVDAPNTSLRAARFITNCLDFNGSTEKIEITEHHQETKKDVSGTALLLKEKLLAVNPDLPVDILSVRDRAASRAYFGDDISNGGQYAGHSVRYLASNNEVIELRELLISGRKEYALGALSLAVQAAEMMRKDRQSGRIEFLDVAETVQELDFIESRPYESEVCYCGHNH